MSHIKSKGTKPEILVRKALFKQGFRYRINVSNLCGCPDIVLPKYNVVIFVNGCFWHGHENCKKAKLPETNTDFWRDKIDKNRKRDAYITNSLERDGWKTVVVWECELKKSVFESTISKIIKIILAD